VNINVCVSVTVRPTSLNLALILGLAALGLLLLLLLLISLIICFVVAARRRRHAKATDSVDFQATPSSSTVSVNLSPSGSSCSRGSDSEKSADSDADAPPAVPAPPPPLPARSPSTPAGQSAPTEEVVSVSEIPEVVIEPGKAKATDEGVGTGKAVGVGVGMGMGMNTARPSWTQSMPSVAIVSATKVPPMIAKKTAKAQLMAVGHAQSRRMSADSIDVSVTSTSADPLPGLGPERPRPAGPKGRYVHVPPKLHREPRGWAPASHAVPAPVKRTWGRAKAKLAAERELAGDENPSVVMSNVSLADDDEMQDMRGSTLSLM